MESGVGPGVLGLLPGSPDGTAPTVFEVALQRQLLASLKTAFDYAHGVMVPAAGSRLAAWKDELFLLLAGWVHTRWLHKSSALISEALYGQHRKPADGGPFTRRHLIVSLLVELFVPYVKHKLDTLYAHLREVEFMEQGDVPATPDTRTRARRIFLRLFPVFHALFTGTSMAYMWAYSLQRSKYASPWLHAAGVTLARGTDSAALGAAAPSPAGGAPPSAVSRMGTFLLRYGFIGALVAFRLAEWWFSPSAAATRPARGPAGPVPPPPLPPPVGGPRSTCRLPADPALCPICRQVRVNDAASTAGILYCFTCITQVAKQVGACPVSGVPCPPEGVRRLYDLTPP